MLGRFVFGFGLKAFDRWWLFLYFPLPSSHSPSTLFGMGKKYFYNVLSPFAVFMLIKTTPISVFKGIAFNLFDVETGQHTLIYTVSKNSSVLFESNLKRLQNGGLGNLIVTPADSF